jgi:hypothetical protein
MTTLSQATKYRCKKIKYNLIHVVFCRDEFYNVHHSDAGCKAVNSE